MKRFAGPLLLVAMLVPACAWPQAQPQVDDSARTALRRAAALAAGVRVLDNGDQALVAAIQAARTCFPVVGISTQESHAAQTVLTLNREGLGLDGVRFTAPAGPPSMLAWGAALPVSLHVRWMIVAAEGNMGGFMVPPLYMDSFECTAGPWPPESQVLVQILSTEPLNPGREYIIAVSPETVDPVQITVRLLAFSDPGNRVTGFFGRPYFGISTNGLSVVLDKGDRILDAMGLMTPRMWQLNQLSAALLRSDDRTVLDRLISSRVVDLREVDAAWVAARWGRPEQVRYVLSRGADPNRVHIESGETPLHVLAAYENGLMRTAGEEDSDDVALAAGVSSLIGAGADPNRLDDSGETPLLVAASHLRAATCQRLIELGADITVRNEAGRTAREVVLGTGPGAWVFLKPGADARRERVLAVLGDAEAKLPPESERYVAAESLRSVAYDGTRASLLRIRAAIDGAVRKDANVVAMVLEREICVCLGEVQKLDGLSLDASRLRNGETVRRWSAVVHERAAAGDPFFACAYSILAGGGIDGADDLAFADLAMVCQRLSKAGFAEATRKLALLNEAKSRRTDEARRRLAGQQGSSQAIFELGLQYYWGQYAPHDYEKAVACFRDASTHGNAVAMVALGRCYLLGQGVARSAEQARVCFTRSQAAGYDMAAKWLAYYFPPPPLEPARKVSIFDDVQRE